MKRTWSDISHAPKDRDLLLWVEGRAEVGRWLSTSTGKGWWVCHAVPINPTHWCFLPRPPEDEHAVDHQLQQMEAERKAPCHCDACMDPGRMDGTYPPLRMFMYTCPLCGNKRCPKTENHRFKCTKSNDVGQVGELE